MLHPATSRGLWTRHRRKLRAAVQRAFARVTARTKLVRRVKQFDRWVGRQVGRLEPHQRRTLGIVMGVCAALSVAAGGVVYLLMKRNGTLPPESESDPFSTGVGIAVMFGYVGVKALFYTEPALTAEQHYQRELRDAEFQANDGHCERRRT